MLVEKYGVQYRHLIHILRTAKLQELPAHYVLKRFTKNCKEDAVFDEDGILLGEIASSSMDIESKKRSLIHVRRWKKCRLKLSNHWQVCNSLEMGFLHLQTN
jgi:hypothetical protein